MNKTAGKRARDVDLSDINLEKIETMDPSNPKHENKVRLYPF
jgi:hypothetical protein